MEVEECHQCEPRKFSVERGDVWGVMVLRTVQYSTHRSPIPNFFSIGNGVRS